MTFFGAFRCNTVPGRLALGAEATEYTDPANFLFIKIISFDVKRKISTGPKISSSIAVPAMDQFGTQGS
jgi:hypothetical protein